MQLRVPRVSRLATLPPECVAKPQVYLNVSPTSSPFLNLCRRGNRFRGTLQVLTAEEMLVAAVKLPLRR